jgi:5-carboxymethyl-2-hydroxymuconate isomerase
VPHCIIEYSKDLENSVKPLVLIKAVHNGAVASKLFDESHIKTRARAYETYKVGISNDPFIHVTASILSGRTIEQKAELSGKILTELKKSPLSAVVITVQICDIEIETYSKAVL